MELERGSQSALRQQEQRGYYKWREVYSQKYGSLHAVGLLCQGCGVNTLSGGRAEVCQGRLFNNMIRYGCNHSGTTACLKVNSLLVTLDQDSTHFISSFGVFNFSWDKIRSGYTRLHEAWEKSKANTYWAGSGGGTFWAVRLFPTGLGCWGLRHGELYKRVHGFEEAVNWCLSGSYWMKKCQLGSENWKCFLWPECYIEKLGWASFAMLSTLSE